MIKCLLLIVGGGNRLLSVKFNVYFKFWLYIHLLPLALSATHQGRHSQAECLTEVGGHMKTASLGSTV
jgi:hypothetical protein